jgi:leader peptidase (prepilin peptidase)/N-methyltransferase
MLSRVLLGALLGYFLGLAVWGVARYFVARYQPQSGAERAGQALPSLHEVVGATSLPAALAQAGMALWGAYLGWQAPGFSLMAAALVVTGLLLTISLVDLQVRRIPNALVLALLAWAFVQALWLGQPTLQAAALGLVVAGGLFLLLALVGRGAMGAGDVKLAAVLGVLLGYPLILPGLLAGALAGGVAALLLLATRRAGRKDFMAYGPYLALGTWIIWTRAMGLWP